MKSSSARNDNNSIKTFFIYAAVVFFFILISLTLKAILIMQDSRFEGKNQFILGVVSNQTVKEILVFHPSEKTALIIRLQGKDLRLSSAGKTLGIITDAKVETVSDLPMVDPAATMRAIAFHYYSLKTNLTIFDAVRLLIFSQKLSPNNQTTKEIVLSKDMFSADSLANLFTDQKIFSENVSIQIINASGTPGIGKRLEIALTDLGCNVISVTTARDNQKSSKMQFFGKETYTMTKLKRTLDFPTEEMKNQPIADIVII